MSKQTYEVVDGHLQKIKDEAIAENPEPESTHQRAYAICTSRFVIKVRGSSIHFKIRDCNCSPIREILVLLADETGLVPTNYNGFVGMATLPSARKSWIRE